MGWEKDWERGWEKDWERGWWKESGKVAPDWERRGELWGHLDFTGKRRIMLTLIICLRGEPG